VFCGNIVCVSLRVNVGILEYLWELGAYESLPVEEHYLFELNIS